MDNDSPSKKRKMDEGQYKVFNDPIHGTIELHPLCVRIIDTKQFQRLRYIKQLGCCYLVYPGAAHNRFEHSLGVCHLAGKLCRALKRQPEHNVTDKDVLCVEIAGLCHDIGHGPFSHVFDNVFIPKVRPGDKWKHEQASVDMFDYLIKDNQLREVFAEYGLADEDITFIKEQIAGPQENKGEQKEKTEWPYSGRSKDKSFLYEIVANKRNGIDVDKWDYFRRDCHNLGMTSSFDCLRLIKFSRVIKVDEEKQICFRDKEVGNLYHMFYTRNILHRRAYQHKVTKIAEEMIVEALEKANDHFKVQGTNSKMLKMSKAIDDMEAYTNLTDDVMLQILRSDDPNLEESRRILELVQKRQLYKYIGKTHPPDGTVYKRENIPELTEEIVSASGKVTTLLKDQLVIHVVNFNYGMKDENPINYVRFYSKKSPNKGFQLKKNEVSQMLPDRFSEQFIRVYCKEPELEDEATKCFGAWVENRLQMPRKQPVTPVKPTNSQTTRSSEGRARAELFQD